MEIVKISVTSSVTKSFDFKSVSCSLSVEINVTGKSGKECGDLYNSVYEQLTDKANGNVNNTIAKIKSEKKVSE